ncbi:MULTISPECIES: hypothetical protein [Terriglobus]|jgi:hypothetical protein|uniref:Uncharacterized protein n=2 Tax=Terriglobus TaxID=392733 RepID=A0A1H4W1V2_9BACT|nr:hypothetical protein [Terriglobus roseus]SEC87286.1 hypothetical protein SAMN05443244_4010 [Terriglobus roseus]
MPTATKTSGSQFDAILAPRRKPLSEPVAERGIEAPSKSAGKLAKSKDPDFRTTTLYLRKKTLANCEHRLKINDDERDMSELVEELMNNWLKEN